MPYYFTFVALLICNLSFAQGDIALNIDVSADTIYMDNAFCVKYIIQNGSGNGFQNPDLKNFQLLQGPSRSSQMSYINGARSSQESYTYYFKPNKKGTFKLKSFELVIDGRSYKSNSPEVIVVANPDSLHQNPTTGQVEGRPIPQKKVSKRKRFKI